MFSAQIEFSQASRNEGMAYPSLTCCISKRLGLRPLELKDTNELFALTDANRDYLRQWLPWLDSNLRAADTCAFIEQQLEKAQLGQEFVSAICYDQAIVGLIGLHNISWNNRSASIGYWLSAAHQGKGVMTLACRSMVDYGFMTLTLNRINICCAANNSRSEAVAKRLGLTYEGTLRDAEWLYDHFVDLKVHSILRYEWRVRLI